MKLHVRTAGAPDATKSAVLIHGITGTGASWLGVMDELAARGYRCYACDNLGHGDSPKPFGGYSHDSLISLIAASVPDKVDLVIGSSFGGLLGALGAMSGQLLPRALVMSDPTHWVPSKDYARKRLRDSEIQPTSVEAFLEMFPAYTRRAAEIRVDALRKLSWGAINAQFVDPAPWDIRDRLTELRQRVPVIYMIPEGSDWVLPGDLEMVRAGIGAENLNIIPNVGHSIHHDDLPTYMKIIDAFTAKVGI